MATPNSENFLVFKSGAFNTTEEKDYFINPGCFGDDVARWLIAQLRASGCAAEPEAGQEDFGWYLTFEAAGIEHQAVIGYRPDSGDDQGEWICWVERKAGLVGSLLGQRRNAKPEALEAIHRILSSSSLISSVKRSSEEGI